MGTEDRGFVIKGVPECANLANNDPEYLAHVRSHWEQCHRTTSQCFKCRVYTATYHFNHNYRESEIPLARSSFPYDPQPTWLTPTPNTPKAPGLSFKRATSACPYEDAKITFIFVRASDISGTNIARANSLGRMCKTVDQKRAALLEFKPGVDLLLVAWPGRYSQDIFAITTTEERTKALGRFGIVPKPVQPARVYVAADGTEYVENVK